MASRKSVENLSVNLDIKISSYVFANSKAREDSKPSENEASAGGEPISRGWISKEVYSGSILGKDLNARAAFEEALTKGRARSQNEAGIKFLSEGKKV